MTGESFLIILTIAVMALTAFLSLFPYIPGPAVVWAIGVVFAAANQFERVTWLAVLIMTVLMVIGSTSEWWLRYLGMSQRGGSCWGVLGSVVGGLLGTLFIPIPILGTLIGAILGALLIEFIRVQKVDHALQTGRSVIETYLLTFVVEFTVSWLILAVFALSGWVTA